MKEAFIRLIDAFGGLVKIKSVLTIGAMIVFIGLAFADKLSNEFIGSIITAVFTYYFTKKKEE